MTTPSALKPQARRPGPIGIGSAPPLTPDERHPPPRTFPGTRGATQGTRPQGFAPAFLEPDTGTIHLACYADGRLAPIHLLAGLPLERVASRDLIGTSRGRTSSRVINRHLNFLAGRRAGSGHWKHGKALWT